MAGLNDNIRYLKGVGETRAKAMEKLGIHTLRDLLSYFPRAYEDRRTICAIKDAPLDIPVCVRAMAAAPPVASYVRKGMELLKLRAVDDSGSLEITWFNQAYLRSQLETGATYIFYGRVTEQGRRRAMANPVFEREDRQGVVTGRILPIYRLTAGVPQKLMISAMEQALAGCGSRMPDILPPELCRRLKLAQAPYAYENIHFPRDEQALDKARERLVFEELYVLGAALAMLREKRTGEPGRAMQALPMDEFWAALPFAPTEAQRRAVREAAADMTSGVPMNRLLQGDVGSGKTLVAAALIWLAVKNGCQAAFMAPTEILAEQHFATLSQLLEPMGIRVVRLTGSMTAAQKRQVNGLLSLGQADVAVGTHALISGGVTFFDLGLVVTDEQHRFGVAQRGALAEKGDKPHTLVMSATPIPRTLALIIYGDLDVSVLDELPPGRQKVDTFAVGEDMRPRIWRFVRRLVGEGRQVFIVCPMVEESEELPPTVKSAQSYAKTLQSEVFPDLRVGCVHGRMKAKEKDAVMAAFAAGELDILVSTTVIEVGVDIPNAALMIVENADRFGLSQLHQLRGRVGRGQHKSYCVLFSDGETEEARARLAIMTKTGDGFKIAEEDLRLRGPGDFFGSRQHGLPEMHIADLSADMRVLKQAQQEAQDTLARDPSLEQPENIPLRDRIRELFEINGNTLN
ncbi:MAG: ATP-dependent DNA helicase RecG [Oscillospiraceae bacterium]|nr:ATP-dependent DNA helicase RecG [Oscillospiraceae bacterium]